MLTFSSRPRVRAIRRERDQRVRQGPGLAPLSTASEPVDTDPTPLIDDPAEQRGWHNSSIELRRGLDIVEDIELNTLPDDLRDSFSR